MTQKSTRPDREERAEDEGRGKMEDGGWKMEGDSGRIAPYHRPLPVPVMASVLARRRDQQSARVAQWDRAPWTAREVSFPESASVRLTNMSLACWLAGSLARWLAGSLAPRRSAVG